MKHSWDKVQDAATLNELREGIIEELQLRAWQERASASIGRTTKQYRAEHEHAAHALENLAADLTNIGTTRAMIAERERMAGGAFHSVTGYSSTSI
jgi:hypothetical protein